MKDLQVAIADYYKDKPIDSQINIKPSVEVLPNTGDEGDCRKCQNRYYIYDNGQWNELDVGNIESDLEFATDDEVLQMLKEGEELARG